MNHYERLKVSQDAPAEVIRAAYRVLAARLHPDRQNGGAAAEPDDSHAQMAALNAAYEVLIDPKSRREYDATLLAPRVGSFGGGQGGVGGVPTGGAGEPAPSFVAAAPAGTPPPDNHSTRVDLNWIPPGVLSTAKPLWPPSRRMMFVGGTALALLIVGVAGVMWQMIGQHQMEKVMSTQFDGKRPPAPPDIPLPPLPPLVRSGLAPQASSPDLPGASSRRPSVEELATMSDEELLKVLPTLDDDTPVPSTVSPQAPRAAAPGHHVLDGQPLGLRQELRLDDPLAESFGKAAASRP